MDNRTQVREFLASRRAKITPERAGLGPSYGRRRVPGLRREEVAQLAGVSTDYYTRLEKGNLRSASDSILDAIATALHLDTAERAHLFALAHAARTSTPKRRPTTPRLRPSVQWILDSMTTAAAFVRNGRLDLLAANPLGHAMWSQVFAQPKSAPNLARFAFLDPRAHDFYPDWPQDAAGVVALLRAEAGRAPHDPDLNNLIGELATRSEDFRVRWATHDVRQHSTGTKRFHHPIVGDLTLAYDSMDIAAAPGLTLTAYTAEPGSAAADTLRLLASWTASDQDVYLLPSRRPPAL
jgi:transcriptional regulator with XRE-family HTH domain